ncbi:DNA-directed DNA polymerase delta subunit POL31 NDAI_0C02800 [Naumovozyma dairenensis CBS 421]|uniref:DNA-directed DNA polymerase n=1 Tax=Naumovozyma dairenensis (strain ATCC 10597 / BCRC 20456 / CBS 421 / NBRC 0211 / NRRL Y-12639) TaxID=1071378 RepID=G0W829_NAUDC|nr:hypothetical protein NDAI_0C02800 [Naumovozyma dairenensis CBS 421]CCD23940.1 hypothetical protein NDAI_0C02800 [Naumovozyma dairenensis CBS 421]
MDELLEKFNENRGDDKEAIDRVILNQKYDTNNPFLLSYKGRDYNSQFYHIYKYRLDTFKERVTKECVKRWDNGFKLKGRSVIKKEKVLDIQGNEPCWCIGTIYCEMKYKPNILEEVTNDTYGAPDIVKSYTDLEGSDEIMLEDESGRVLLVGDYIRSTPFITGTVIGILGMEADAGTFQVLDICYPAALPQKPLLLDKNRKDKGSVALVSGININSKSPGHALRLQLLQEYLMGRLDSNDERVSKIGKLIICGNSVDFNAREETPGDLANSLAEFGKFLGNSLQSISIDLMPGVKDPSARALPQQPFNKALFSEALRPYFDKVNNKLLNLVTNPYQFNINDVDLLTVSGQSVNDIHKYVIPMKNNSLDETPKEDIEHRLDLMECTMKWQNIAPTAPDTVWCYPFKEEDPFVLKEWPHVYIVANQPEYGTRDLTLNDGVNVKIISVPEFSKTGSVILLDLNNLESEVVTIEL